MSHPTDPRNPESEYYDVLEEPGYQYSLNPPAELSIIDTDRLKSLRHHVFATKDIEGSIIEVGVFRGGSLKEIADTEKTKQIYGFDTFSGLPEKTPEIDVHRVGWFTSDYDKVSELFSQYKNVTVARGTFPADFLDFNPGPISLAHIDVDMYRSTLECMRWVDRRLSPGGILICDDYGAPDCPGAKMAVHEFLNETKINYTIISVVNCQIVLQRCK